MSESPIDGLWRVRSVQGWTGLEPATSPEFWWFGGDRHVLADARRRPTLELTLSLEVARGRFALAGLAGRRCYLFERAGDELRLYGGDRAFPARIGDGELPTLVLERDARGLAATPPPPQLPPERADPVLGTLRLEPGGYTTTIDCGGRAVALTLDDEADLDDLLPRARRLAEGLEALAERAARFAGRTLIDLKNSGWLRDGQRPLSAAALARRFTLLAIDVDESSASLEHDDGGEFLGHRVHVTLNRRGAPTAADI